MILVTGGSGLVGSHLLLELTQRGEKVRAIYRTSSSLSSVKKVFSYYCPPEKSSSLFQSIDWQEADLTDLPQLEKVFKGVTVVYHCAAVVSFDPAKDAMLRKVNIEGTANVVNCCISTGVSKLCHVSSIATLDKKLSEKLMDEGSYWNKEKDHDMYAITKYGAEMEAWRGSQEGVPVVIVNPGVILGPGFWNMGSGKIFSRMKRGTNYYLPKITGFVGVRDVVYNMYHLMNSPIENEQFVMVSENLSFKEIQDKIASFYKLKPPQKEIKKWMLSLGWLYERFASVFGRERMFNRQTIKQLKTDHYYSSKKLLAVSGSRLTPIDEVLRETCELFLSCSFRD